MRDLSSILSLFRVEFNKCNYIGARMSKDTKSILKPRIWLVKAQEFSIYMYIRNAQS